MFQFDRQTRLRGTRVLGTGGCEWEMWSSTAKRNSVVSERRENGKLFHFETVKFTRRKKEKSWEDVAGVDATKEENMNS